MNKNDRFKILEDWSFWNYLQFEISGYFGESQNTELNRFWIDGFEPYNCSNTKDGIDVNGIVWVMLRANVEPPQGHKPKYNFKMTIPQKMLYKKIEKYDFEVTHFDSRGKNLELRIMKPNH